MSLVTEMEKKRLFFEFIKSNTVRSTNNTRWFCFQMKIVSCLAIIVAVASALDCGSIGRLSDNWNETIAHSIHSMTTQGLRMFKSSAVKANHVPTVNQNLQHVSDSQSVVPYAPDVPLPADFVTHSMQTIDRILTIVGTEDDGLGPNWSPVERIVHTLHMWDLWAKINEVYKKTVYPGAQLCKCLAIESEPKGQIYKAVQWVAEHYKTGTPITVTTRPIPKLVDAPSWAVWRDHLLAYYNEAALLDAATYMHCVTQDL